MSRPFTMITTFIAIARRDSAGDALCLRKERICPSRRWQRPPHRALCPLLRAGCNSPPAVSRFWRGARERFRGSGRSADPVRSRSRRWQSGWKRRRPPFTGVNGFLPRP